MKDVDTIIDHFFKNQRRKPKLRLIEDAEVWDVDDLKFRLYKDDLSTDDWYVAVDIWYYSSLDAVVSRVHETFMVDVLGWCVLSEKQRPRTKKRVNHPNPERHEEFIWDDNDEKHIVGHALLWATTNSPSLLNK